MTPDQRSSNQGAWWLALLAVGLCAAWSTQEHYPPWTAFHSDWIASFGLLAALAGWLASRSGAREAPAAVCAVGGLALVPLIQYEAGVIFFAGDAILASLYLLGFASAIQLGCAAQAATEQAVEPLLWAIVLAALWSVALALAQWLRLSDGIADWAMPLKLGERPYANFGQPNQLATFLVWGLLAILLLAERRRITRATMCAAAIMLLLGIALTQSRAAWVELVVVAAAMALLGPRASLRLRTGHLLVVGLAFVTLNFALPALADILLTGSPIRPTEDTVSGGTRPIHWATVLDAIREHPWVGYGWNQTAVAVARFAPSHAASGEMIEHSHNMALDLLAWNGVVLGSTLLLLATAWLFRLLRDCRDATSLLLLTMVLAATVHALLEFPLEYAYFLFPVGVMLGAAHARPGVGRGVGVPRFVWGVLLATGGAALVVVGVDYLRLEQNHRELRMESAGIGTNIIASDVPDVVALTQLQTLLKFARTEASRQAAPAQVAQMRQVAERFGYPPVLFRYALVAALHGDRREAERALIRICKQHSRSICNEAKANWTSLQQGEFSELRNLPYPVVSR